MDHLTYAEWIAIITGACTVFNTYIVLLTKNEVLKLKLHVTTNFVSKTDCDLKERVSIILRSAEK